MSYFEAILSDFDGTRACIVVLILSLVMTKGDSKLKKCLEGQTYSAAS